MSEISTQIGVDVLGFPIYRVLIPKNVIKAQSKFNKTNKKFENETIYQISTVKQR